MNSEITDFNGENALLYDVNCLYYAFIGLCLVSFGLLTFLLAGTLTGGGVLARSVCVFLGVFCSLRLLVASRVFDVSPYLINRYRWLGYHATNIAFAYLPLVYFLTAWTGGNR